VSVRKFYVSKRLESLNEISCFEFDCKGRRRNFILYIYFIVVTAFLLNVVLTIVSKAGLVGISDAL